VESKTEPYIAFTYKPQIARFFFLSVMIVTISDYAILTPKILLCREKDKILGVKIA